MYVPITEVDDSYKHDAKKDNVPMFLARRVTLTKDQITSAMGDDKSSEPEFDLGTMLDCCLCKNIMVDPKECNRCNKGFCKKCVNDYMQDLQDGEYAITCPNCGKKNFKPSEPHPLVMKTLYNLKVTCMNAKAGCTVKVAYADMAKHLIVCDYATLRCPNYGCEKLMFQKDWPAHKLVCEFRTKKCEKCDFKLKEGQTDCNDCV